MGTSGFENDRFGRVDRDSLGNGFGNVIVRACEESTMREKQAGDRRVKCEEENSIHV